MADVFISYSKQSQAQTEQLANELRGKGLTVWYDTSLVPGNSFRDVIMSELAQARGHLGFGVGQVRVGLFRSKPSTRAPHPDPGANR
jgi:hypothetical protein